MNGLNTVVDCHFVQDYVMSEMICTPFTLLSAQLVDIFTKTVSLKVFLLLCD